MSNVLYVQCIVHTPPILIFRVREKKRLALKAYRSLISKKVLGYFSLVVRVDQFQRPDTWITYDMRYPSLEEVDQTLERRSNPKVIFAQIINDPRISNQIIRTLKKLSYCLTRSLGFFKKS